MHPFNDIKTRDELDSLVEHWMTLPAIAIDTEFVRTNTYYSNAGLIQIADRDHVYLIDPLAIDDLHSLSLVITSPKVVKVIHAMSEDIDLLRHTLNVVPANFFDTQIAAGFGGFDASMGYQRLVNELLNVELDKAETRSDWLKRPLTESQLKYAGLDVYYLLQMYDDLVLRLQKKQRLEAVWEECNTVLKRVVNDYDHPELAYLKMRFAYEVSDEKQRLLKKLVEWRERRARKENKPKTWIVTDKMLLQIARKKPQKAIELNRIQGVGIKHIQKYGEEIAAICGSPERDENFIPIMQPLSGQSYELFKRFRKVIREVAESESLEVHQLVSKKDLERLAYNMVNGPIELSEALSDWKYNLMGEKLEIAAREVLDF